MEFKYNTVEDALEALRQGKVILVTDENEHRSGGLTMEMLEGF